MARAGVDSVGFFIMCKLLQCGLSLGRLADLNINLLSLHVWTRDTAYNVRRFASLLQLSSREILGKATAFVMTANMFCQ
jgi:hypothetical protein